MSWRCDISVIIVTVLLDIAAVQCSAQYSTAVSPTPCMNVLCLVSCRETHINPSVILSPTPSLQLPIWDHLEELRERVLVALLAGGAAIGTCFAFSKDLVLFLEAPVADAGVRFLQLSPGEFFFTTFKVCTDDCSTTRQSPCIGAVGCAFILWL